MGGNAFEAAQRMNAREYGTLYDFICRSAEQIVIFEIPKSYFGKESFGDLDLIVETRDEALKMLEVFRASGPNLVVMDIIKNPSGFNVLAMFLGKTVQIDINIVGEDNLNFAYWYFSFNDLGNLIGRIAHRQGLKFGHNGLWYVLRDGTQVLDAILLTKCAPEAMEYLGFDVSRWLDGFEELSDMFEWVVDCKNFDGAAYPLEHRNHKARTRDNKRQNYTAFLQYLKDYSIDTTWYESNKEQWLEFHIKRFPHLGERIETALLIQKKKKLWNSLYGGDVVKELLPLEGKELGVFMNHVRAAFDWTEDESVLLKDRIVANAAIITLYLRVNRLTS